MVYEGRMKLLRRPRLGLLVSLGSLAAVVAFASIGCSASYGRAKDSGVNVVSTTKLSSALAAPARPEAARARDVYRHPQETLQFFGLRPDMNVVELSPGGGWYTAILAPVLAKHGQLHVTNADPNGPPDSEGTKSARALLARFAADPATFGKVDPFIVNWKSERPLGESQSLDMVLTFRSVHGWVHAGTFDAVLAGVYHALKPGGVFGVVEHRANPGASTDPKVIGDTGYVPEAFVIERATVAGFNVAAKSEINANAKDTKDYPKGVWTLPPTFELGATDHEKYAAIGESDRMTIKLVKP